MAEAEQTPQETQPGPQAPPAQTDQSQSVTWTASEFIAHDKSPGWYLLLFVCTLAGSALVFLITRDKISVAVVMVAGLAMGVYAGHKPRQLEYQLGQGSITAGGKSYNLNEFRSFSVVPEGAFAGITFMPLKRFGAPLTVYYAPDDEEKIMTILSAQLPFEEHHGDAVDRLMRKIGF